MRRAIFWFGWAILGLLPIVFAIQIFMIQDLPRVEPWKWLVPVAAVLMIVLTRNRDDVLHHRVA